MCQQAVLVQGWACCLSLQIAKKEQPLKLPEARCPEEVGKIDDSNYCLYHRMLGTQPEAERVSVRQGSSERQGRRIVNTLLLWRLGSIGQHPCQNHSLQASATLKINKRSSQRSLADLKAFITQIPAGLEQEDEGHCLQTSEHFPCITFSPDDMQVIGKHDRWLCTCIAHFISHMSHFLHFFK